MNDRGSITGDGLMIHEAGDDSQWEPACSSTTSSHVLFITLNCPDTEVSNLQECGVMDMEDCDSTLGINSYAAVTCLKCKTYLSFIDAC